MNESMEQDHEFNRPMTISEFMDYMDSMFSFFEHCCIGLSKVTINVQALGVNPHGCPTTDTRVFTMDYSRVKELGSPIIYRVRQQEIMKEER